MGSRITDYVSRFTNKCLLCLTPLLLSSLSWVNFPASALDPPSESPCIWCRLMPTPAGGWPKPSSALGNEFGFARSAARLLNNLLARPAQTHGETLRWFAL